MTSRNGLLIALLLISAGCQPNRTYHGLTISEDDRSPSGWIGRSEAGLSVGGLLVFRAVATVETKRIDFESSGLSFVSDDDEIARVHGTIMVDTWSVLGKSVGTTDIQVRFDGELVETISIQVD